MKRRRATARGLEQRRIEVSFGRLGDAAREARQLTHRRPVADRFVSFAPGGAPSRCQRRFSISSRKLRFSVLLPSSSAETRTQTERQTSVRV